jgi:hypothetical protein
MLFGKPVVGRPLAPAHLSGNETHFLAHQRRIFRRDIFTQRGAHHLEHQLVAGIDDRRLRLARLEQLEYRRADFVLDILGHARVGIGDQPHVAPGLVGRLQPARITGHVHENHQQHADVALGDG